MSTDPTLPDIPVPPPSLPPAAWEKAREAYRAWRIGDGGEGRLHAALLAAAPLIRAEAEAKLAEITALCRDDHDDPCWPHMVEAILAVIGGEQPALSAACTGPDCGEQFADSETGEYEFATRERMERLLDADGWQADPVLCPACQEEAGS